LPTRPSQSGIAQVGTGDLALSKRALGAIRFEMEPHQLESFLILDQWHAEEI